MGAVLIHIVAQRAVGARYGRYARFLHRGDRGDFIAHQANGVGFRADEDKAGLLNLLGKVGVLGQEAVTRVDSDRAGNFGSSDNRRDVQIAFN